MGQSTDGQLCFGISFEEGYGFPWDEEEWEGDIENWWFLGVCGYKSPYEIYDGSGEYINGERPPGDKIKKYYEHRRQFEFENTMPIEMVMHCSCDYPMYIASVKGTTSRNSRGYEVEIDIDSINVTDDQINELVDFCKQYFKPQDEYSKMPVFEPKWYLTSLWC